MSADPSITCAACGADTPGSNAFCGICGARLQEAPADSLLGKVIAEKFRVVRLLGSGGMGAIYLAEHVGIGKRVAIKLLRADLRGHPHLVKRFRREAMAVSRLTDAHTITVFDFGVWDGVVYLVMEYLIGDDLSKALAAERRLTSSRALSIAHQICSSLAEAHTQGVVHRDLKPENVFLTRTTSGDELVKVLDFGLAKILLPEGTEALLQTADGALMGTPYYMAPEQVKGEPVDRRTDLYALGGLLFRMLTGQVPYVGKSPLQVMEAHVGGDLRRFVDVDPQLDVPPAVEALVRRLMARAPDDRPDSALAVDQEILSLLAGLGVRSEAPRQVSDGHPAPSVDAPVDTRPDDGPGSDGRAETAPGRPSVLRPSTGRPAAADDAARDPADMSFSDARDDGPRAFGPPPGADPRATSWSIGDTAPPADRPRQRTKSGGRAPWAILLILLAAGAGAGGYALYVARSAPPTAEVEPNDDPATASPLAEELTLTATLGPGTGTEADRDVYVVAVPPERPYVRVRASGIEGLRLVVEGVGYDGTSLFTRTSREAGASVWASGKVETDRLLIVVRAEDGVTPAGAAEYRLNARFRDRPRRERRGRNDGDADDGAADDGADAAGEPAADSGPDRGP